MTQTKMDITVAVGYYELTNLKRMEEIRRTGVRCLCPDERFFDALDERSFRQNVTELHDMGFVFPTTHPPFCGYNDPDSPSNQDHAMRHRYIEMMKRLMERYHIAGIQSIPIHTSGACTALAPDDAFHNLIDTMHVLQVDAKAYNMKLGLENTFYHIPGGFHGSLPHPTDYKYAFDTPERLKEAVLLCDQDVVGICLDVGHAFFSPFEDALHDTLTPYIVLYHLQDTPGSHFGDYHLPLGYGKINWQRIAERIRNSNYQGVLYAERTPWTAGDYASLMRETEAILTDGVELITVNGRQAIAHCSICGHMILKSAPHCPCEAK